jgi:diguanylate cyclase (GGDEF)-like protein/PAS domain S-box-containing protein
MFKLSLIVIALSITTAINGIVTFVSWKRRRGTRYGFYFALGMIGVTLWTFAASFDYASIPLDLKIQFSKMGAVGYHSAFALFAVFSIYYAGNEHWLERKWLRFLLVLIPVTNILLTITNELHRWVWTEYIPSTDGIYIFEYGSAFDWIIIDSYALIVFIFFNTWTAYRKGSDFTKRQARILMFALLFPVAINLLYRLGAGGIRGVDWTSITFSISSLLFAYALYGIKLLDIVPIARDKLLNNLTDPMLVLDFQNRIVDINHRAAKMLGAYPTTLIGRDLSEVIPAARSLLEQPPEREVKDELSIGSTDLRYFDVLISPVWDERQTLLGRLIVARDITARKEAESRLLELNRQLEEKLKEIEGLQVILREQAIRDPLTGVYNRHFLNEALKHELARADREGYRICFILMDLDGFKKINDTYGHAAGDVVIQHFSDLLKKTTRTGDIVCRYGGEEFLLVLPNAPIASAAQIAERLRHDFENSDISYAGFHVRATTSCGVSEFPSDGGTAEKVLAAADMALYSAKERGKNRVILWSEIAVP